MKTLQRLLSRKSRWRTVLIGGLVSLLYLVPFLVIPGFSAGYLKIGDIKGEATAAGHEEWIKMDSVQFQVLRPILTDVTGRRSGGTPKLSEMVITKTLDKSSPILMQESAFGQSQPSIQIDFTQPDASGAELVYLSYTLSDVLVSSFSSSGSDRPTESLSLNFSKIEMKYTPVIDGKAGTAVTGTVSVNPQ